MTRAIKNHASDFAAIVVLLILSIVVAGYILSHERLRFPFIESSPFTLNASFSTGQAVTAGQGQTVRVSGVQIGQIGQVQLKNGVAQVQLNIDDKYKHLIHTDATALLRPRTGLKDMFIEVNPGTKSAPVAKAGFTVPVSNTLPDVNLDEILSSLDADTRTYLNLLVNGAGQGLKNGGGNQLAQVLERFEPTHRDLARLNQAVAARGQNLRRLINSLQRLNTALAGNKNEIVSLIDSSSRVFRAFASQDTNISRAVADLPGTLRQTTATLQRVQVFANLLGPTANNLIPAARAIPAANAALTALAVPSAPIIKNQIRPFVIAARPTVRNLRPASINLAKATPSLNSTFGVLNHLFNMLGYNPGDAEHGYLWWLAWLDHDARTLFSVQDANGDFRPLFLEADCYTLRSLIANLALAQGLPQAVVTNIVGLTNVLGPGGPFGPGAACSAGNFNAPPLLGSLGLPGGIKLPFAHDRGTQHAVAANGAGASSSTGTGTGVTGTTTSSTSAPSATTPSAGTAAGGHSAAGGSSSSSGATGSSGNSGSSSPAAPAVAKTP